MLPHCHPLPAPPQVVAGSNYEVIAELSCPEVKSSVEIYAQVFIPLPSSNEEPEVSVSTQRATINSVCGSSTSRALPRAVAARPVASGKTGRQAAHACKVRCCWHLSMHTCVLRAAALPAGHQPGHPFHRHPGLTAAVWRRHLGQPIVWVSRRQAGSQPAPSLARPRNPSFASLESQSARASSPHEP